MHDRARHHPAGCGIVEHREKGDCDRQENQADADEVCGDGMEGDVARQHATGFEPWLIDEERPIRDAFANLPAFIEEEEQPRQQPC